MADLQTITIAAGSGDTGTQALTKLYQDLAKVAKLFADTSDPTSPEDGTMWFRSDGTPTLYLQIASVKTAMITGHLVRANLDFAGNQALNFRAEGLATGSLTAAGAGVKGQIEFDTTLEKWVFVGTTARGYGAVANLDATSYVRIPCALGVAGLGTPATASTATEYGGWTLDAAAEEINVLALEPIPNGWTTANDLVLEVRVLLLAAETANDTLDLDGVWQSLTPGVDATTKTETGFVAAAYDIASGNAQYTMHVVELTVDHDDATNPVAIGDQFKATINHDATGAVAGVIVVGVALKVPVFGYDS